MRGTKKACFVAIQGFSEKKIQCYKLVFVVEGKTRLRSRKGQQITINLTGSPRFHQGHHQRPQGLRLLSFIRLHLRTGLDLKPLEISVVVSHNQRDHLSLTYLPPSSHADINATIMKGSFDPIGFIWGIMESTWY